MRIALGIEYDGTAYNGWQRQNFGLGVQEIIERALVKVADHEVETFCAGRTDAGVHATGQVIHFDTSSERQNRGWLLGVNSYLPDDISVRWARHVGENFHARFSAISRNYSYLILNRLERSAIYRNCAWWVHKPLKVKDMNIASQYLLGEHDFSAFRAAGCGANSSVRKIMKISIEREGDWIKLNVTANAFLQHMVRNIVGTLIAVGEGNKSADWLKDILNSGDRKKAGVAAPPHGLTLVSVDYPSSAGIPIFIEDD
ncbi:MAG: tRNA pseudouridine(38-40) synthase TruA [Woeseia sp.]|nr:tRNA pseudouridine(38-40) synthase TruA [Woeseia sp.]|tara:strand:- start:921 stop:1691 length:771 start_codon:yes stop_codon:yes gene_type:complete